MNEDQVSPDVREVFREAAAKEAEAYELFGQRFEAQHPAPVKPTVRLMNAIGWQFVAIIFQSAASIILAALRTAHMFFEAAAAANITLRYVDAGVSVFAIEFGVVVFAAIKSETENRKNTEEDLRAALKINTQLLWTGIVACVAVSIIAGLGTSFSGFGVGIDLSLPLAIVMGAGASIVAWVSGDILGATLARLSNAKALAELEYKNELDAREEKKKSMWDVAPERSIARSELVELKDYLASQRTPRPKKQKEPVLPQPKPRTSTRNNEVRQGIYRYMDEQLELVKNQARDELPGPTELMREKGVSKGYASDVIKDWKRDRGIPTSETEEPVNAP